MPFALWITGLLGSGKTTISKEFAKLLKPRGIPIIHLELDQLRTHITPNPHYTEEERDFVYRALIFVAMILHRYGHNVIIDATAHRRRWRTHAKETIPGLIEVYAKCPIELCTLREAKRHQGTVMAKLYENALERLRTGETIEGLGQVPGIDVEYEESESPDITLQTNLHGPTECARLLMEALSSRGLIEPCDTTHE
ncbi:MAG: adenylyl-sulfate kinase [Candidatus Geothermarchaeales archaeon]